MMIWKHIVLVLVASLSLAGCSAINGLPELNSSEAPVSDSVDESSQTNETEDSVESNREFEDLSDLFGQE